MDGQCALCRSLAQLRMSHFLPAAFYRAIGRSIEPHASAPVIVDHSRGTSAYTNRQPQKHLLCSSCEQRFSKLGEDVVTAQCIRDSGKFALRTMLQSQKPHRVVKGRAIWTSESLAASAIDTQAYIYFVLSLLWRGSVTDWGPPYSSYKGALGPQYEEKLRRYLLGEAPIPNKMQINIYVDFADDAHALLAPPNMRKSAIGKHKFHEHVMVIPGSQIIVLIGGDAAVFKTHLSVLTFFEWRMEGTEMFRHIARTVQASEAKGKLAKELGRRTD